MIRQIRSRLGNSALWLTFRRIGEPLALLVLTIVCVCTAAPAQTFTVLHSFTGGNDGGNPIAGLTIDRWGNLYGTASYGGSGGYGVAFKMFQKNSSWILTPLHGFLGTTLDGCYVVDNDLALAPDGSLYGTTQRCGNTLCSIGCGIVYRLRPSPNPPATPIAPWTETILYYFRGYIEPDPAGKLAFDSAGNIFGSTRQGGIPDRGYIYELSPSGSGYVETEIYTFQDMNRPSGVIFDSAGNLYGTTIGGEPDNHGTVFKLSLSGSQWVATALYTFQGGEDGKIPIGDLIADAQGNLYGTTSWGGTGGGGTVFEMSPDGQGGWVHTTLAELNGNAFEPPGPQDALAMDSAGNLYGIARLDGAYGQGNVFKLTKNGGTWTYTDLHDFTGGDDGGNSFSNVVIDAQGNLYGTTAEGGAQGFGVVWKIVQ